jgi:addiction module RelB/DinJ family antitoxin
MDAVLTVRIDKDVKDKATSILHEKGLSISSAVQMLFDQIVKTGDLPVIATPSRPSEKEIQRRLQAFDRFQLTEPLHMTDEEIKTARIREKYDIDA